MRKKPMSRMPWFKHFLAPDTSHTSQFSNLETIGSYHLLQVQYFILKGFEFPGLLPEEKEDRIKLISKAGKKWPEVRRELLHVVFTKDWRQPHWDAVLEEQKEQTEKKKDAADARWGSREPAESGHFLHASNVDDVPF